MSDEDDFDAQFDALRKDFENAAKAPTSAAQAEFLISSNKKTVELLRRAMHSIKGLSEQVSGLDALYDALFARRHEPVIEEIFREMEARGIEVPDAELLHPHESA